MKKNYFSLIALLIILTAVFQLFAAEKPDFSGTWAFDRDSSEFGEGGDRFIPTKIEIAQAENSMTVKRSYQGEYGDDMVDELTFTLDGEKNESEFWNSPRVITATWNEDGTALTIETTFQFNMNGDEQEMSSTDVWTLTKEGKVLHQDFTFGGPMGEMKSVYIFTRTE